jgi:hypothetical protein
MKHATSIQKSMHNSQQIARIIINNSCTAVLSHIFTHLANIEIQINFIYDIVKPTCSRPWLVHGAYESDMLIHSLTILWYKERIDAIKAGSLITAEGESL